MAETLGSLCDKLTIIKLKELHCKDMSQLESLKNQEKQLKSELNEYLIDAISGKISLEHLTFSTNKIYKREENDVPDVEGSIAEVFSKLAQVNCNLWHEQEHVYEFEKVPVNQKDKIVKHLALLNLERNKCIDYIDKQLQNMIKQYKGKQ